MIEIIFAIPSANVQTKKEILDICKESGCKLRTLPGMYQLINGEVSVSKLKEVEIEDLLGREPICINVAEVLDYLSEKTVLVTGEAVPSAVNFAARLRGITRKD